MWQAIHIEPQADGWIVVNDARPEYNPIPDRDDVWAYRLEPTWFAVRWKAVDGQPRQAKYTFSSPQQGPEDTVDACVQFGLRLIEKQEMTNTNSENTNSRKP
ncbi:hypothetical protein LLE49_00030 [Alicyclobacillus tolerans]|uniref:hypothetical protein n=1 Tax=Alicyclobacillus tolerans TaxID=90970 RepID=UPI001F458BC6|nr:hypothetical protein [Alicyclobacillus tolerans]MCF8563129.1 hypothetical protein [Alicyclobacillus tolerans]